MRRLFISCTLIFASFCAIAQVSDIIILSEKEYEDNYKTVYLEFEGNIPFELKTIIEDEIQSISAVKNFSFYDKENMLPCMITCRVDFDFTDLKEIINNAVSNIFETTNQIDLKGTHYDNGIKTVKFRIVFSNESMDISHLRQALTSSFPNTTLAVNNDSVYQIWIKSEIPWYEVDRILKENGVKEIIPIF